jgi:tRNA 2-selenouridine synthase
MGAPALNRPDGDAYAALLLADTPLIDTRSPLEFAQGALPNAVNLPLMLDDERAQVGLCYKRKGQAAAVELGHSLVSGDVKAARVRAWCDFAGRHPDGYLYCFRGGLRSQIAQQWLRDAGCDYPRIRGGYKVVRRFLLDDLEAQCRRLPLRVVSGQTGSGKTALLQSLAGSIDLEALANHRGSAFGKRVGGQPMQIDFENALAVAALRHALAMPQLPVLLEDESQLIGRVALPDCLRKAMQRSPLWVLEVPLAQRVQHTYENYILRNLQDWQAARGEAEGFEAFAAELQQALHGLHRRLGGLRYERLSAQLASALVAHRRGHPDRHRAWIRELLVEYYDPMYAYQLGLKADRVVFRGGYAQVLDALSSAVSGWP